MPHTISIHATYTSGKKGEAQWGKNSELRGLAGVLKIRWGHVHKIGKVTTTAEVVWHLREWQDNVDLCSKDMRRSGIV